MPKSTADRQKALRERRAAQGLTEVRGLYARPEHHAQIKALAATIAKQPGGKIPPGPAHGGAPLVPD